MFDFFGSKKNESEVVNSEVVNQVVIEIDLMMSYLKACASKRYCESMLQQEQDKNSYRHILGEVGELMTSIRQKLSQGDTKRIEHDVAMMDFNELKWIATHLDQYPFPQEQEDDLNEAGIFGFMTNTFG